MEPLRLTLEQIEAGRSPAGGFTKVQLASWGVPWPPPAGWQDALLNGEPIIAKDAHVDYKALFIETVMAVINAGQGEILMDHPNVLDALGARVPAFPGPAKYRVVSSTNLPGAPF